MPKRVSLGRASLRREFSPREKQVIRVFAGACTLSALVVLLSMAGALMGRPLPPAVVSFYRLVLLWALVASAHAFWLLLVFAQDVKEDLSRKSFLDELTSVFNFRYLDHRLDEEEARIRRQGGSAAVLFLDLDHFKEVNDRYGHQVGNAVLRGLVTAMKKHVRASDVLGRLGGDEFLVIMPHANRQQAVALAHRLRKTVKNYRLKVRAKEFVDFVRVSIGLAVYPQNGDSMEGVVIAADRAVYRAKARGGNTVCAAEEFISTPGAAGGDGETTPRIEAPASRPGALCP